MKKHILTFIIIFLSLNSYSQRRQMFVKNDLGFLTYKIKDNYLVKVTLANGDISHGRIKIDNDTQFILNKDTIHIDSVTRILRIKKGKMAIGHVFVMTSLGIIIEGATEYEFATSQPTSTYSAGDKIVSIIVLGAGILEAAIGMALIIPFARDIDGDYRKLVIKTK